MNPFEQAGVILIVGLLLVWFLIPGNDDNE